MKDIYNRAGHSDDPPYKIKPNSLNFYETHHLDSQWRMEFAPNCFIYTATGLNWFHRLMQRLILGFRWERISKNSRKIRQRL